MFANRETHANAVPVVQLERADSVVEETVSHVGPFLVHAESKHLSWLANVKIDVLIEVSRCHISLALGALGQVLVIVVITAVAVAVIVIVAMAISVAIAVVGSGPSTARIRNDAGKVVRNNSVIMAPLMDSNNLAKCETSAQTKKYDYEKLSHFFLLLRRADVTRKKLNSRHAFKYALKKLHFFFALTK